MNPDLDPQGSQLFFKPRFGSKYPNPDPHPSFFAGRDCQRIGNITLSLTANHSWCLGEVVLHVQIVHSLMAILDIENIVLDFGVAYDVNECLKDIKISLYLRERNVSANSERRNHLSYQYNHTFEIKVLEYRERVTTCKNVMF